LISKLDPSITHAEKDAAELVASQTMSLIKTGYGKEAVKAKHVSADELAQPLV
jgi:hypothetical protein